MMPPRADSLLRQSLNQLSLTTGFNSIKKKWPEAERITQSVAAYLTGFIPDIEGQHPSLLHKCLLEGVYKWDREGQCFYAYMRGLTLYLPEVLEWSVYTEIRRGNDIWNPLTEGLSDWWQRQRSQPLVKKRERPWDPSGKDITPHNYRTIALVKLLDGKDFHSLGGSIDYIVGRHNTKTAT